MTILYSDRFQKYRKVGLGLRSDAPVQLADHHPRWQRMFSYEAYVIHHTLNIELLRLHHCGSTAVAGLPAKPIVDILGVVPDLTSLEAKKALLESLGYDWRGECGIQGRRFAVLSDPATKLSYVHLHLYQEGDPQISRHIAFRDILRTHPEAASQYRQVKQALNLPRPEYTAAKAPVIDEILAAYSVGEGAKIAVVLGAAKGHKNTVTYAKELYSSCQLELIDLQDCSVLPYAYNTPRRDDDFIAIVQRMIEADRMVFATPVYWYAMSAEMKTFVDRLTNLLNEAHKSYASALVGKKVDLVVTGSDILIPNGFTVPFNLVSIYFGMDFMQFHYRAFP